MAKYTSEMRIRRGPTILKFILGLIIVIAAGALTYGTYQSQRSEVNRLNKQVTQLNQQVTQLNKSLAAAKNKAPSPPADTYTSPKGVTIKVYTPASNAQMVSPVIVLGEVPGSWSFEAVFPVKLLGSDGTLIARGTAQLLGSWTTDQLVPFSVKIVYNTNAVARGDGTLVLQKDNPSGLAANDDSVSIPIKL
jgi:outer membrane murein-binding lipoprotein Lpp